MTVTAGGSLSPTADRSTSLDLEGWTRSGGRRTTWRRARSTCWITRCWPSSYARSTSSRGCSALGHHAGACVGSSEPGDRRPECGCAVRDRSWAWWTGGGGHRVAGGDLFRALPGGVQGPRRDAPVIFGTSRFPAGFPSTPCRCWRATGTSRSSSRSTRETTRWPPTGRWPGPWTGHRQSVMTSRSRL